MSRAKSETLREKLLFIAKCNPLSNFPLVNVGVCRLYVHTSTKTHEGHNLSKKLTNHRKEKVWSVMRSLQGVFVKAHSL